MLFNYQLNEEKKKRFFFEKIDEAVAKLLDLKKQLAEHQGADGEEAGPGGEKLLKNPRVSFFCINYEKIVK